MTVGKSPAVKPNVKAASVVSKGAPQGVSVPASKVAPKPGAKAPAVAVPSTAAHPKPTAPPTPLSKPSGPRKPMKPKPIPGASITPPGVGGLLASGAIRKPLIPSGPKAAALRPLGMHGDDLSGSEKPKIKSPFGKRDLDRFRALLIHKRAELMGDVSQMESEALQGGSGALSNVPQHIAEQGSDAYDQSLSLDLAAADRRLIKEIEDAIKRIENGTYGICELTFKPIKIERLEELPWARYSIEAARELERRAMRS